MYGFVRINVLAQDPLRICLGSQLFFTLPSTEYTYNRPQVKQRHLKFKIQDDMMFHCVDRQCTGRVSSVGHHS